MKEYPKARGILHCYPGNLSDVEDLLDRFYIGVGGTVTFKNNHTGHKLVESLDLKHIVLETDSPYLTPVPYRGKQNNPIYVEFVAEKIASLKNISVEEVKRITTENALRVYGICLK